MTVEYGWPVGMPTCRPLEDGVYEVRTNLSQNRIGRVLFYIDKRADGAVARIHQEDQAHSRRRPESGGRQQEEA